MVDFSANFEYTFNRQPSQKWQDAGSASNTASAPRRKGMLPMRRNSQIVLPYLDSANPSIRGGVA